MRATRIKERGLNENAPDDIRMTGWLNGRQTYLFFKCRRWGRIPCSTAGLDGYRLYRLAKAIVRHWEADKK